MRKVDFEDVIEFHGHLCGGLTIGYKAARYAGKLLDLERATDEEIVCIAENDACGVDAIQTVLGCSVGKGNLLFHMTGKQAFSIYNRLTGESVRLVLKPFPEMSREEHRDYFGEREPEELFEIKPTQIKLPAQAELFRSFPCAVCGEITGEHWMRVQNGEKVCRDCYTLKDYNRFDV